MDKFFEDLNLMYKELNKMSKSVENENLKEILKSNISFSKTFDNYFKNNIDNYLITQMIDCRNNFIRVSRVSKEQNEYQIYLNHANENLKVINVEFNILKEYFEKNLDYIHQVLLINIKNRMYYKEIFDNLDDFYKFYFFIYTPNFKLNLINFNKYCAKVDDDLSDEEFIKLFEQIKKLGSKLFEELKNYIKYLNI